ncbi:helix-turn-helix domain-containing protein [[Clostridium] symbiosum]|uniref:helix-turn-helix domain-containing protein n=1 Tax=Clostridium symbiosum TaxID=1512 RepID=UPI00210F01DD|nr:helix-turn-helix domain-containing protein [[Clostridium] symbiosum]MCQ4837732.1 helix-turn-helix domain-containing protein [[Clostridium] symbiosum]
MNSVGERLAYTRSTILSMNQKDFSKLLGVSQGALSEIENNKRGLPMEAIIELMKYSKTDNSISCSWILTGISDDASESALSSDEKELISTYNKLDRRGQHRVHTIIYEELDRMDKTPEASASRSIS